MILREELDMGYLTILALQSSILAFAFAASPSLPTLLTLQNTSSTLNSPLPAFSGSWVVRPRCFTHDDYVGNGPVLADAFARLLQRLEAKPTADLDERVYYRPGQQRMVARYRYGPCFVAVERSNGPFYAGGDPHLPDYEDIFSWREIIHVANHIHQTCDVDRYGYADATYGGQTAVGHGHGYAVRTGCYERWPRRAGML